MEGADVPRPVGLRRAALRPQPRHRPLEAAARVPQVDPEQARGEGGEEPEHRGRAHQVGDGIGHRDVVHEPGPLGRRQRQSLDGLARGPDHGRFRERAGQETRRRADVVAQQPGQAHGREQGSHADDHGEGELRQRVLLEPPEELGADLVPGREQEEVEEDRLHGRGDRHADLADDHSRQESAQDWTQRELPQADASEEEPDGERQEERQLGVLPECLRQARQAHDNLVPLPLREVERHSRTART